MRSLLLTCCVLSTQCCFYGQELVPNGSFEEYTNCPQGIPNNEIEGVKEHPHGWYFPVFGNRTYFNKCSNAPKMIYANPRSGRGCMGIQTFFGDNREYISAPLNFPLKPGEMYCVKFYVALHPITLMVCSYLGAVLSQKPILDHLDGDADPSYVPQIVNKEKFLSDTAWTEISGIYTAHGGESVITIGNFTRRNETPAIYRSSKGYAYEGTEKFVIGAYYFIDDVSVVPIKNEFECSPIGKPVLLGNVFFDTGKSILLTASFKELDKLAQYMNDHKDIQIEINGHTDSLGSSSANKKLSAARAKAVADYLVSKGINRKRITNIGYGDTSPIATNGTEEGRKENRRVEFVLNKK